MSPPGPGGIGIEALRHRERHILVAATLATCAVAWIALVVTGFGSAPVTATLLPALSPPAGAIGYVVTVAMWFLMMLAMMLPSTLPWLTALAALTRGEAGGGLRSRSVLSFAIGYFGVWLAFAAGAALTQLALHHMGLTGPDHTLAMPLGGGLLVAAGLYQATPFKSACLRRCRNPLGFFLRHWRDGPRGAARMGTLHGLFCVGCCWALMTLGLALGVMNLAWMAALTVLVTVENVAARGTALGRIAGLGLVAWGLTLMGLGT